MRRAVVQSGNARHGAAIQCRRVGQEFAFPVLLVLRRDSHGRTRTGLNSMISAKGDPKLARGAVGCRARGGSPCARTSADRGRVTWVEAPIGFLLALGGEDAGVFCI